jgi:hypothetical protein
VRTTPWGRAQSRPRGRVRATEGRRAACGARSGRGGLARRRDERFRARRARGSGVRTRS